MSDKPWFAPRRFGYGFGPPISWQGWLVAAIYGGALVGTAILLLPGRKLAFTIIALSLTATLLAVAAPRTRGGLRWRCGQDD